MKVSITILALNALKEMILHFGWPGVAVVSIRYSGWIATGGGANKHSISSTHTLRTMYVRICIMLVSAERNENFVWYRYHTGQLSVALSKSKVPSAWQAMLKVDFDRSDSQKRVGVPSIFAPCSLWSVLEYICSFSWAKLCACFVHCTLCTLSSTMTLYFYDAVSDTVRRRG